MGEGSKGKERQVKNTEHAIIFQYTIMKTRAKTRAKTTTRRSRKGNKENNEEQLKWKRRTGKK